MRLNYFSEPNEPRNVWNEYKLAGCVLSYRVYRTNENAAGLDYLAASV